MLLLSVVFLGGCEEGNIAYDTKEWCIENKETISCEQLLDCYDNCDDLPFITHSRNCRDSFKARIWKCYGGEDVVT